MKNIINSVFFEQKKTTVSIMWFGFLRLISLIFSLGLIGLGVPYILGKMFYNENSLENTIISGLWLFFSVLVVTMFIILIGVIIYSLGTKGISYKENK